jgi:hypothetical protein
MCINEMHGSRSIIPTKNSRQTALRGENLIPALKGLGIMFAIFFYLHTLYSRGFDYLIQ